MPDKLIIIRSFTIQFRLKPTISSAEMREKALPALPIGGAYRIEEIAKAIAWLMSPASLYAARSIDAIYLAVDAVRGGWRARSSRPVRPAL
jgi:hypothetical protein